MLYNWHSLNYPKSTSGYENNIFSEYAHSFEEVINSYAASDLILMNGDMGIECQTRGIIQGKLSDTQLKSLERQVLLPVGYCKAGMYIKENDKLWLVNGVPDNNGFYEKATVILCQYKFRWQNKNGDIVERWGNVKSASQYNNGEDGDKIIVLHSNQLMIQLPLDCETLNVDNKRMFIDSKEVNPDKVYRITRNDDVIYDFGKLGGIVNVIATRDQFNKDTDDQIKRICDYFINATNNNSSESYIGVANIKYTSLLIRSGLSPKKFVSVFKNNDGSIANISPLWEIKNCDFIDKLTVSKSDKEISISAPSDIEYGEFFLTLKDEALEYEPTSLKIEIQSYY